MIQIECKKHIKAVRYKIPIRHSITDKKQLAFTHFSLILTR